MKSLVPEWTDYQLLDSGAGKKLERFGEFTLVRPEPQAKWQVARPNLWQSAQAEFVRARADSRGRWDFRKSLPARWPMQRKNLKFWVQPAPSGHVGVFPDQACHWDWIAELVGGTAAPLRVLSLFGHTGLASLAAAAAGAHVTHVDASRQAVACARENQTLSGLDDRAIRWIVDDALVFLKREARRGNEYHGLILDPPKFGRGPKGQIWKVEESLPELLAACRNILATSPLFVLLNVYTTVRTQAHAKSEAASLHSYLRQMLGESRLTVSSGELSLEDPSGHKISASTFARACS
jgi:23S rRNA (cytosine1962-C5)-methyltransferase